MTRTSLSLMAVVVGITAVLTFAVEWFLVRLGEPMFTPPLTLTVALLVLAVSLPALAWPILGVTRPREGRPQSLVDPFYATRVLLFAKASAVAAAVFVGGGIGALVFIASRPVVVWSSVGLAGALTIASAAALVASLVAERWCELPPPSEGPEAPGAVRGKPV